MNGLRKHVRLVYVGPGLSGRTTSLLDVRTRAAPNGVSIESAANEHVTLRRVLGDTTFSVDASVSVIRAWLAYDLESVTADPRVRAEVDPIEHADGLVFVVDSQRQRWPATLEAYDRLHRDLLARNVQAHTIPTVFQINKRDLPNVLSAGSVQHHLRADRCRYVESIATKGIGTLEALDSILELILDEP